MKNEIIFAIALLPFAGGVIFVSFWVGSIRGYREALREAEYYKLGKWEMSHEFAGEMKWRWNGERD